MKYAQVYSLFFITPMEIVRAKVDNPSDGTDSIVSWKLRGLSETIDEVKILEEMVLVQVERIKKQKETEQGLAGLPLPGIRQETLTLMEITDTLLEWKVELGYPGYTRISQRVDLTGRVDVSQVDRLSLEDRKKLVEFGEMVKGMIQASRTRNA